MNKKQKQENQQLVVFDGPYICGILLESPMIFVSYVAEYKIYSWNAKNGGFLISNCISK